MLVHAEPVTSGKIPKIARIISVTNPVFPACEGDFSKSTDLHNSSAISFFGIKLENPFTVSFFLSPMASIILRKPSNKRINPDKLFEFDNFGIPDFAIKTLSGAFRDNIRVFLQSFAEIQDHAVNEMRVWCTSLFSANYGVFPLYTLEETVRESVDPFCEYCELAGALIWSTVYVILF